MKNNSLRALDINPISRYCRRLELCERRTTMGDVHVHMDFTSREADGVQAKSQSFIELRNRK